jgi:hypothetical protein
LKSPLLLVCLVCAPPCMAAEPLEGVLACRAITDSAARLACFDRETAALAGAPASSAIAAPVPGAQQSFGVRGSAIAATEEATGGRPAELAKLESHIVALALTGNGRTLFTLDNTQVWKQLESDGDVLARLGDSATISRGALGSYWLQLKSGRGCKVTRVR